MSQDGRKEREKGMQSINRERKDQVGRCKRTGSRQADYRDQNAIVNTGRSAPFLSREERAGRRRDGSSVAHCKAQPGNMQRPSPATMSRVCLFEELI